MGFKLCLIRDGEILCEFPLSPEDWLRDDLERECDKLEEQTEYLLKILDVFTNENRLRMMKRLLEEDKFMLRFNDFITDLKMNPKIIREHAHRLSEAGFIDYPARGKYRLSNLGKKRFITAGLALRRILEILDEEFEY